MSEIIGERLGGEPEDESEHFMPCGACGQALDCRDWDQVAHHEVPGHGPFATPARLLSASLLLGETLRDAAADTSPGKEIPG